eukprot:6079122-Amphidinium_carterae.1
MGSDLGRRAWYGLPVTRQDAKSAKDVKVLCGGVHHVDIMFTAPFTGLFQTQRKAYASGLPRMGRLASTPAAIQQALHEREIVQAGDMFPGACLAPVQAVVRPGQQRR